MKTIHYFNSDAEANVPADAVEKEKKLRQTLCGYARRNVALDPSRVTCKKCRIELAKNGYVLDRNLAIQEKLLKIYFNCSTRKFEKVFSEYAESRNISKWDGRKKDNSNSYYAGGEDEYWDRVICNIYLPKNEELSLHMVLRKNSYFFITSRDETIFEYDRREGIKTYEEEKLNKTLELHRKLFNMLLANS